MTDPSDLRGVAVLVLMEQGMTTEQAAHRLGIAARTADDRLRRLRDALGAASTLQAAAMLRRRKSHRFPRRCPDQLRLDLR